MRTMRSCRNRAGRDVVDQYLCRCRYMVRDLLDWAVQIAAIPRPRSAWPRCAALGDFASQAIVGNVNHCRGDGERAGQPKRGRDSARRPAGLSPRPRPRIKYSRSGPCIAAKPARLGTLTAPKGPFLASRLSRPIRAR
jgi:hypothetical protein